MVVNLSLNQTLLILSLYVRETLKTPSNFSLRGYIQLIQKESATHMHGLVLYNKEGLPLE